MVDDLGLIEYAYGLGASLFFIGYLIFEVPSNVILERVGARRWFARIMVSWGRVTLAAFYIAFPLAAYGLSYWLPTIVKGSGCRTRSTACSMSFPGQSLLSHCGPCQRSPRRPTGRPPWPADAASVKLGGVLAQQPGACWPTSRAVLGSQTDFGRTVTPRAGNIDRQVGFGFLRAARGVGIVAGCTFGKVASRMP